MSFNINSEFTSGGGTGEPEPKVPTDPSKKLGFEIDPPDERWVFIPTFYPDRFVQTKPRKLKRDSNQCDGEDVSLKKIKNREFHASGIVLASEIQLLQLLLNYTGVVDVISPLTPNGGMECRIDTAKLGEKKGYSSTEREWMFKYSLDLVSTGKDEYGTGENEIVSDIIDNGPVDEQDVRQGLDAGPSFSP
jgi:hypothetical protein